MDKELKSKVEEAYMKEDVGGASMTSGAIAAAAPVNVNKVVVPSMCASEDKKEKEESLLEKRLADRKAKMKALEEMTDKMEESEFNQSLEEKKQPKAVEIEAPRKVSLEERLEARKAKISEVKHDTDIEKKEAHNLQEKEIVYEKPEVKVPKEPTDKYVANARKYYEPQEFANGKGDGTDHRTGYSGPSDYEKQRKEWQKRRYSRFDPKRDKTTEGESFFDSPNYNPIGRTDFDKRFDNGAIDDFLAWYRSREDDKPLYKARKNNVSTVDQEDHLMFENDGDDEPIKGKKAKVKESSKLQERSSVKVMTVGDLRKLLSDLPEGADIFCVCDDDELREGIYAKVDEGNSWTFPSITFSKYTI
ncbi:MAG: hypothetical protein HUJ68_09520 [Clostridia bacterium]|nr:hypothetical protein [Clostridia bacterium]